MLDGTFRNPTVIFFGRNVELNVGIEVKKFAQKALLVYGNKSFKKYGLYERVTKSMTDAGVECIELGGVCSNPTADLVYKGIDICRRENVDFILAVGGGSVIDSAKAIGIGVPFEEDFYNLFEKNKIPKKSLKVGVILTIPGAGSESGGGAVITHKGKKIKTDCSGTVMFPVFAMLNPELTYTVPAYHTSCGIVDSIAHVLERYFTNTPYVECTNGICEGLIKTLMKYALLVKKEPQNYDIRAELMWASKLAHDNVAGFGRKQDWACHLISHEIGVRYDVAHGAILSVLFVAWMKHLSKFKPEHFIQFANNIMGVDLKSTSSSEAIIAAGIKKYQEFLFDINMPLTLQEIGFSDKTEFNEIACKCASTTQSGTIGNFVRLTERDITDILTLAY